MPDAPSASPLTATSQQATQALLLSLLLRDFAQLWPTLDIDDLKLSLPTFSVATTALVQRYGLASGALAADYYDAERSAAKVGGRFTVTPATPADVEQVTTEIKWATKGLWSTDPDPTAAQTLTSGVVEKLVADVGRDTLTTAVRDDKYARGWARVPEPGCCYFCAMLAVRGAVYKKETAGTNARSPRHATRPGEAFTGAGDFKVHDHCRCHVEPVFTEYEPTAQIREWQGLYRESTRGKSNANARLAFRQAFEGRTPTTPGRPGS